MKDIITWVKENGIISHEEVDLICAYVGKALIRIFPLGSDTIDKTPWASVRGPNDAGVLTKAYYHLEDFKKSVLEINE